MCRVTLVSVVGAGVMGCATAWALAGRGAEVTLHEQFELDHARGSSHGRSRIVRFSYPQPEWVRLAEEARGGWRDLEAATGYTLLELYGFVELASAPELTSHAALAACGVEHRLLSAGEARELGFLVPPGWCALEEATGGIIRADLARRALLETAIRAGVRLETGSRVESLDRLDADVVVVTPGAWLVRLVPDVPVRVTRETVAYFRYDGPPLPSLVELGHQAGGHVMYALYDPVHGVKAGAHHGGVEVDPDDEGAPDDEIVARTSEWVRRRLPGVDPSPVAAETCLYTTTADEGFVLERRGRVVVGSACSGHGFKFAPVVGQRLADLALR
jgi:sarcosine oxidase